MFNKLFKQSGKTNRSLKENIDFSGFLDVPGCGIALKMSQKPSYMEKRLLELHKNYSDLINILQFNNDLEIQEKAIETATRMWYQHVFEVDPPEVKALILDQSKKGLIKALTYLDDRVLKSLEHYKRTGELASNYIWIPAGSMVIITDLFDEPLT